MKPEEKIEELKHSIEFWKEKQKVTKLALKKINLNESIELL